MKKMENKKSRGFCGTDYLRDIDFWRNIYQAENVRYLVIGDEVCPTSGRLHYQFFVYFTERRSPAAIRKLLAPRHIERVDDKRNGHVEQNYQYCSKEKIILELSEKPAQGKRVDIETVAAQIKNGEITSDEVCWENPVLHHQYGRTFDRLEDIRRRKEFKNWKTECD